MFAGIGLEQFQHLPNKKQLRQQAKAINFGLPGGLGAASLVSYAKHSYGVDMTLDQATQFRTMLTELVYPELKLYLSEDSATVLAATLQTDAVLVRSVWSEPRQYGMLRKVVEGKPQKADGTPYSESTVNRVWQQLAMLNQNPVLVVPIANRDTSDTSPLRRLMCSPVATPTGRIRGGVGFTAARNTPFQGLAADGAKLAMWELVKAGYRIAAFVHDEFVIELPAQADHTAAAQQVERICCTAMQQLLGDIPVSCEYALADRWYKQAAAVTDNAGKLTTWKPI
jgi:DNA polymerase I-like protein with 3'-5' exonuclease and polymerase domains